MQEMHVKRGRFFIHRHRHTEVREGRSNWEIWSGSHAPERTFKYCLRHLLKLCHSDAFYCIVTRAITRIVCVGSLIVVDPLQFPPVFPR